MRLTKDFSISEFAVSADHPYLASKITFSEADKIKLFYLCSLILQPVRDWLHTPVKILSGKRSRALNSAIPGASPTSDHLFNFVSAACDFTISGFDMERVWLQMQGTNISKNKQPFGQLIFYPSKNFVHVSLPTPKHHGEVFTK